MAQCDFNIITTVPAWSLLFLSPVIFSVASFKD
jgi:hypothetical protein